MEEGRTKQKDFAAKAYGFLVSCYYFIWPQSEFEFESESAFVSASHFESGTGRGSGAGFSFGSGSEPESWSDMQLLQRPKLELGTPATVTRGA